MKGFLLASIAAVLLPAAAAAQTPPPLPRADAHFVIGWQNLRRDQPQDHDNDWLNQIFYGGAGAGWYWTENLKTQVDVGTGTRARQYRYNEVTFNGAPAFESSELSVRQWAVTVGQQYQFFHNAWFHPHVGGGI